MIFARNTLTLLAFVLAFQFGCGSLENSTKGERSDVVTIVATAGEHGRISPSGEITVAKHGTIVFLIDPDKAYVLNALIVDGKAQQKALRYRFENVEYNHSIQVTFKREFESRTR
jgi:hypothetical protein